MEYDIIFRLSFLAGFLLAGFLILSVAVIMLVLRGWYRSSLWELDRFLDECIDDKEERWHP